MTGVELIVAAFGAGIAASATEQATSAVRSSFTRLLDMVRRRLREDTPTLTGYSTEPQLWETRLVVELIESGADRDEQILAAARHLLGLTQPPASGVDLRGAKGVQVGDHNIQSNTFS